MTAKLTFEEALIKLEGIVKELEKGDLPLNKSLEMFEEGIGLLKFCNDQLDNAELKVSVLMKKDNGQMQEEDFITSSGEGSNEQ